jgi:hypothetical protein
MFIEKARHLESSQAIGGIIIDHKLSLKSSTGAIFSMSGDGNNNVHIPVVLMFKDEVFQLLYLLSKQPKLIIYIGEKDHLEKSFYQQTTYLESLIEPFNQTTEKWLYGQWEFFKANKQCSIISNKLKQLELAIKKHIQTSNISIGSTFSPMAYE